MPAVVNKELWAAADLVIRNRHSEYPLNFTPARDLWRLLIDEATSGTQHCPHVLNYIVKEAVRVGREEERARCVIMIKKSAAQ